MEKYAIITDGRIEICTNAKGERMKDTTLIGRIYDKTLAKIVPTYAVLSLILCFGLNSLIYFGANILMGDAKHYDIASSIDKLIPFCPEWITIYLFCYIEWTIGYIVISRQGKEHWFQFAVADMISRLVCGVFYIFFPTTMARPEIVGNSVFEETVRILYSIDPSSNLFPSIHCLVSWFCYIGVRGKKNVSIWYKIFMCVYAILVFISTVTLKQHVIADIIAGVVLAEVCYLISKKTKLYVKLMQFFERVNKLVFGIKFNE